MTRRLPIGAEVLGDGTVHVRVWAPRRRAVQVVLEGEGSASPRAPSAGVVLAPEPDGYFAGLVPGAHAGSRYRIWLDEGSTRVPDPASRFQPDGPHGASEVIDPGRFPWTDAGWPGLPPRGQVLYELHVGTFTPSGTWEGATQELPALAALGVTAIELMPVAEFPGCFGWGYDGVALLAPTRLYGMPDDFRRFVDCAHAEGLGVILDVVYNHLGPDGNYLRELAEHYFTDRHANEWGDAIDFDGPHSAPVRELILSSVTCWIDEYHLDGLRLDATQAMHDGSSPHIVAEIARRAREAARGRRVLLVAENEPQETRLVRPLAAGGFGLDAVWSDDFHHSAMVALTGRREAYYTDYRGGPQEFVSAAKHGHLYQGQWYSWQRQPRGTPGLDLAPETRVVYLQNHDQVANSAHGLRCHQLGSAGRVRALTALLLLGPGTPMLFQGQEFAASSPFLYFADLPGGLAGNVRKGRAEFLQQFVSLAMPEAQAALADPGRRETFERSRLDLAERERHASAYGLHRDLIRLRRQDPVFGAERRVAVDGAVVGPEAFLLRYFASDDGDRLLIVNLGADLDLAVAPEPLLAPPLGRRWTLLWSSEDPRYGGSGTSATEPLALPGQSALAFAAEPAASAEAAERGGRAPAGPPALGVAPVS